MKGPTVLGTVAILALGSSSACQTWTELDDVECPPEGTELTYQNYGRGFLAAYCNRCHSADATDRKGAPQAIIFDTYDQTSVLRDRIFLRAAADNITMPPGPDDPPIEERDKLAEWLACGAPEQ